MQAGRFFIGLRPMTCVRFRSRRGGTILFLSLRGRRACIARRDLRARYHIPFTSDVSFPSCRTIVDALAPVDTNDSSWKVNTPYCSGPRGRSAPCGVVYPFSTLNYFGYYQRCTFRVTVCATSGRGAFNALVVATFFGPDRTISL